MIKRFALLIMIFILFSSPASVLAASPDGGVIEGLVVNGTEDGSSVADQEITLTISLNNAEVDKITTRTDAEGYFVFNSPSTEPGYSYQVTINFQQADYTSDWLSFADGESSKFAEVIVYDATTSNESIKVMLAHTVIYPELDSLYVEQYSLIVNESDRTYIGTREITEGVRETLWFPLPDGATELQPGDGLMECCIYSSEDGFFDSMPVLPGGKELIYSYRINYDSREYVFSQKVNYPTISYDLMAQGENIKLTSNQLVSEEPLLIQNDLFNHLSGKNLNPGDTISVQLSGLSSTSNQGSSIVWIVLTLLALTGGFSFIYLLRRRKPQTVSSGSNVEQMYQGAIAELAQLDNDFEDGKIDEEGYHRLRTEKKSQIIKLMKRAKEKSGN